MSPTPTELMTNWLKGRLSDAHWQWLDDRMALVRQSNSGRDLDITLGLIPRKLGRDDLAPDPQEIQAAHLAQPGWDPRQWSIDTVARLLVVSTLAKHDPEGFDAKLTELCRNADLAESITLYSGFALYPHSKALDIQIGEGLRTNMRAVFEAIAHCNPYPRLHFDQNRWNHMVLKALFIDSTLAPIQGLDERTNPELATILCDYAHERWAANRPVTPELWRCVGPHATGTMLDDLVKVSQSDNATERNAALLALSQCNDPAATDTRTATLAKFPAAADQITSGQLTWESLCSSDGESLA